MTNIFMVLRDKGNVVVSIMFDKSDYHYHFVNLTKGHICSCGFESVSDAIRDMEIKKANGEIINFIEIK